MLTLYGIPNCDTVRKTQKWLDGKKVHHQLHNYRQEGITQEKIESWLEQVPLEKILNKASTTFKNLPDKEKESATAQNAAVALMVAHPTLIKRPVVEDVSGMVVAVGFKEAEYAELWGE